MYHIVGFITVWTIILLVSTVAAWVMSFCLLNVVRAKRILDFCGKAKDKPYLVCWFLVWRASILESPSSTSFNGRYFPLLGRSYYKDYEED